MINSVSHDSVSCLVADRPMCFATALDKAFENIDCMSAILRCQVKNHIYESTQRLIQPRRVLCLWHQTDMPTALSNVRSQGQSGKHMLALSFSGFDPGCVKTRLRIPKPLSTNSD